MQTHLTIEELLDLYHKAVAAKNKEAQEIMSKAILDLSERNALEESIKTRVALAHRIIHGGSV